MGWTMAPHQRGMFMYQCWCKDGEPLRTIHAFEPSANIAHALEVIAHMRSTKNSWFSLNWYGDCEQWFAGFGDGSFDSDGRGDTAPHAICLAALKAAGGHG